VNPPLCYPGLTAERRVVLDLAFCGYGLSSQIVSRTGELLGIADPATKFDPVPGAIVARVELGVGLARLVAGGGRFDLIVADIPRGATCAAVGVFAPPPRLMPPGARRILGCAPPAPKPPAQMSLALAVWRAMLALLSDHGEALVRLHESDVEAINGPGESRKGTWWSHRQGGYATAYVSKRTARKRLPVGPAPTAPNAADRSAVFGPEFQVWTTGQRASFQQLLK
jgi:hypothetical protein